MARKWLLSPTIFKMKLHIEVTALVGGHRRQPTGRRGQSRDSHGSRNARALHQDDRFNVYLTHTDHKLSCKQCINCVKTWSLLTEASPPVLQGVWGRGGFNIFVCCCFCFGLGFFLAAMCLKTSAQTATMILKQREMTRRGNNPPFIECMKPVSE